MLRSLKELEHYTVCAPDGKAGKCADFLLGIPRWLVRYLVVKTARPLSARYVLITPDVIVEVDRAHRSFQLALTKDQVERSPLDDNGQAGSSPPHRVSTGTQRLDDSEIVISSLQVPCESESSERLMEPLDLHGHPDRVRSAKTLRGFAVRARDGCIGHVDDLIVQDDIWELRYFVLDTGKWWTGRKVLIAPQWAESINWGERTVHVNMSVQAVRTSPEWDPNVSLERDYETRLFRHYGLPSYWGKQELNALKAEATDDADLIERQRHQHE